MKRYLLKLLLLAACQLNLVAAQSAENIRTFEPESFNQIIAGERGKPFVVMVWSLDCEYCQASFEALARAKQKNGLDVITIATDRADDAEASLQIKKKLKASGLASNIWAFGSAPAEQLRYAIDPKWRGEMPRSYWFNARGEAVAHSGVINAEIIEKHLPK
jgi:thiol-disulfide isomerase/thioredoxin